ncbi:hypothetical protein KP509_24G071400 [Ceratopteris richardii]|nr:hypothetical protein KP509_24G071400 [Ceratopteris richardii]
MKKCHRIGSSGDHIVMKKCHRIGSSGRASTIFSSSKLLSSLSLNTSTRSSVDVLARSILPKGPLFYELSEIATATNNFGASQKIGSSIWRCELRGSAVAIVKTPGASKNFKRLLWNMYTLHHINLVKVLGGCCTPNCIFVVYELIDGVSLQSCLSSAFAPHYCVLCTWTLRMQVATDVAKGLEYVHEHVYAQSAHKYLTSRNIMLMNSDLHAKITLVGMTVLTGDVSSCKDVLDLRGHDENSTVHPVMADADASVSSHALLSGKKSSLSSRSMKITASTGYVPPEYAQKGIVSQKYDVYTFGIVLLELLRGKAMGKDTDLMKSRKASIIEEAESIFSDELAIRKRLRLWIDPRLKDSYPVDDAINLVSLALSCIHADPDKRPTMRDVSMYMTGYTESAEAWDRNRSTYTGTCTLDGR